MIADHPAIHRQIATGMSVPAGAILQEAYNLNVVQMPMFPAWYEITGEFPPTVNLPNLGSFINKLLYYLAITVMWILFKPTLDKMRATVGLDPISWSGVKNCMTRLPTHHTWSTVLQAKPSELFLTDERRAVCGDTDLSKPNSEDWIESTSIGGYLFYESPSDVLHPSLEQFLSSGPPPVYVGFGSMPIHLSAKFIPLIKDLLSHLPTTTRGRILAGKIREVVGREECVEEGVDGNGFVARAREVGEKIRGERGAENAVEFVVRHANRRRGEDGEKVEGVEVRGGEESESSRGPVVWRWWWEEKELIPDAERLLL
ncbi:hypothetical protein HDU98_005169 [Podochytrium sp. JEL0797]|nr:hypothetical protein HDU98_005169 [Podochytrium sp. JEL0797]